MKKLFITIAFVAAAMFAQAQFFVGGGIGFGTSGGTMTSETAGVSVSADQPKTTNFTIAPSLGFMFSENMGIGIDFNYTYGKDVTKITDASGAETTTTLKGSTIGFKPYFRYVFAEVDNFKFYADAYVLYKSGKPSMTIESAGITITGDGDKTTNLDFGIQPGMAYMLTDNISMNCKLNILAIAYRTEKIVSETTDTTTGDKTTVTTKNNWLDFGINGFGFDNYGAKGNFNLNTVIEIGFFYTF